MIDNCNMSLRAKTLENVMRSNLPGTDKERIAEVFMRYTQSVELVRCIECRFFRQSWLEGKRYGWGWCSRFGRSEHEVHFCSYGERKDGAK